METGKQDISLSNIVYLTIGIVLIGVGNAILRISDLGTDPFTCMNLGLSKTFNFSYAITQIIINIILFIPMIISFRSYIGIGTIFNMLGISSISDACMKIFDNFNFSHFVFSNGFISRIFVMTIGTFFLCFGLAIYINCSLGTAPYDALGQILEKMFNGKVKFSIIRVSTDILCIVLGFLLGSRVGIATIIIGFCTGPVVSLLIKVLNKIKIKGFKNSLC